MDIFESLENLNVSEECFEDILNIVEEYISLGGISLRLVDTAGIRESSDKVEQIGIERAKENIKQADLCLFVVDASEEITEEDIEIAKSLDNKKVILLLNKQDKGECFDRGALEKLGIAPEDTVSAILAERYSSLFSLIPVSIVFLASASITRFT